MIDFKFCVFFLKSFCFEIPINFYFIFIFNFFFFSDPGYIFLFLTCGGRICIPMINIYKREFIDITSQNRNYQKTNKSKQIWK